MQKKWWQEAVVYQIYCKSFCDSNGDGIGDLQGVISKLPMIKELGVDCIWFNPLYKSPMVDNGYDISDYEDIDPRYGTMDDFKELLEKAHSMGIRVIMDLVLNHTSDEHKWFKESRKSKDNPYRNFYYWRPAKPDGKEPNNWGNYFYEGRGSAWQYDELTGEYYLHNYSYKMPDVNWEYEPLRQAMYKMMRFWLDMGIDGFRLDAVNRLKKPAGLPDSQKPPAPPVGIHGYVVDRTICANVDGIHELLREIARNTWGKYDVMTVGETGQVTADMAPDFVAEDNHELNMVFHFELGKNVNIITPRIYKETQKRWSALAEHNSFEAQYLSNHDTPRQVSRFGNDKEYRIESAELLATLTHTMPGCPFVYQGEEIGMTNVYFDSIDDYDERYTVGKYYTAVEAGADPVETLKNLQPLSRDNVRTPYQWNDKENAGFTTGKPWIKVNPRYKEINLEADLKAKNSIFKYYQKIIAMRKTHPAMVDGKLDFYLFDHEQMIVYTRSCMRETLLIVANFSDDTVKIEIPEELKQKNFVRILSNREETSPSLSGDRTEWLPWETEIYELHS